MGGALSIFLVCWNISLAQASLHDYRVGFLMGFGGAGINTIREVDTTSVTVHRSEGPLIAAIFIDWLIYDSITLAIEDVQGFRLGPFSSGVSFYGLVCRWYFLGQAPSTPLPQQGESLLFVKRYSPYLGYTLGAAFANISRESDQVPSVTGSGVYYGLKAGFDYPLKPGRGLRAEIGYSTTFQSATAYPIIISEFLLGVGLYFNL